MVIYHDINHYHHLNHIIYHYLDIMVINNGDLS